MVESSSGLGFTMSEERFTAIEGSIAGLRSDMHTMGAELRSEMQTMGTELRSEMQAMGAELGHQMRLLHEHLVDQIASLSPDYHLIDRRVATSRADLREELLRRIEPLEAAERARRRSDN